MHIEQHPRRKLFIGLGIAASLGLAGLLSSAWADGKEKTWRVSARRARAANPIEANAESIRRGGELWQEECESCHGEGGKGDGPESKDLEKPVGDMTSSEVAAQSDGELYWKITLGRRPMPGYRQLLSDQDRWHLVNFVRTLAAAPASASDGASGEGEP